MTRKGHIAKLKGMILRHAKAERIVSDHALLHGNALMLALLLRMTVEDLERHVGMLKKTRRRLIFFRLNANSAYIPRKVALDAAQELLAVMQWERWVESLKKPEPAPNSGYIIARRHLPYSVQGTT